MNLIRQDIQIDLGSPIYKYQLQMKFFTAAFIASLSSLALSQDFSTISDGIAEAVTLIKNQVEQRAPEIVQEIGEKIQSVEIPITQEQIKQELKKAGEAIADAIQQNLPKQENPELEKKTPQTKKDEKQKHHKGKRQDRTPEDIGLQDKQTRHMRHQRPEGPKREGKRHQEGRSGQGQKQKKERKQMKKQMKKLKKEEKDESLSKEDVESDTESIQDLKPKKNAEQSSVISQQRKQKKGPKNHQNQRRGDKQNGRRGQRRGHEEKGRSYNNMKHMKPVQENKVPELIAVESAPKSKN